MGNFLPSTTPTNIIDEQIKEECIVMYSTTVCSFCTKAKSLMSEMGLKYSTVEIDQVPPSEGGRISHDLRAKTRIMTVSVLHNISSILHHFLNHFSTLGLPENSLFLYSEKRNVLNKCEFISPIGSRSVAFRRRSNVSQGEAVLLGTNHRFMGYRE